MFFPKSRSCPWTILSFLRSIVPPVVLHFGPREHTALSSLPSPFSKTQSFLATRNHPWSHFRCCVSKLLAYGILPFPIFSGKSPIPICPCVPPTTHFLAVSRLATPRPSTSRSFHMPLAPHFRPHCSYVFRPPVRLQFVINCLFCRHNLRHGRPLPLSSVKPLPIYFIVTCLGGLFRSVDVPV